MTLDPISTSHMNVNLISINCALKIYSVSISIFFLIPPLSIVLFTLIKFKTEKFQF